MFVFYCSVMPLLILDFNAGLFVAYVNVFLLAIIWLLWYTDICCCKAGS